MTACADWYYISAVFQYEDNQQCLSDGLRPGSGGGMVSHQQEVTTRRTNIQVLFMSDQPSCLSLLSWMKIEVMIYFFVISSLLSSPPPPYHHHQHHLSISRHIKFGNRYVSQLSNICSNSPKWFTLLSLVRPPWLLAFRWPQEGVLVA